MTEQEWMAATDPEPMLEFLRGKSSDRQLRLFAVACCRRVVHLLPGETSRRVLDLVERHADGWASDDEIRAAGTDAEAMVEALRQQHGSEDAPGPLAASAIWSATSTAAELSAAGYSLTDGVLGTAIQANSTFNNVHREMAAQAALLRDVFGNPFRPVPIDPAWLSSDVVALARGIYRERAFDRLPILADALQDAGCDNPDVLNHCRSGGPHVRGCRVIDLLLGKE